VASDGVVAHGDAEGGEQFALVGSVCLSECGCHVAPGGPDGGDQSVDVVRCDPLGGLDGGEFDLGGGLGTLGFGDPTGDDYGFGACLQCLPVAVELGVGFVDPASGGVDPDVGVEIEFGRSTIEAPIVAVVSRSTGGFEAPAYFVDEATLDASVGRLLDTMVFIDLADGAAAPAEQDVRALVRATPGSFLETRAERVASIGSEIAALGNFVDGVLILASVIALLGVANTTALAINERSGEIGLLRAVGASRRELRRIVRIEAALPSFGAASIGIVVAAGLTWALIDVTGGTEIPSVVLPWPRLAVTLVAAVAAGVGAAAWPAFRVSRVPTLELVSGNR
jgi:hypothetical protein